MVLCILTAVLLFQQAGSPDPVAKLLAFSEVATTAGGRHAPDPPLSIEESKVTINLIGEVEVTVNGDRAFMDRRTGRIRAYFGSSGYSSEYNRGRNRAEVKPVLSREMVEVLCNLYAKAAWPECGGLKFRKIEVDDRNMVLVEADFVKGEATFPLEPVVMEIDPLYGRLRLFSCVYPPEPPPNLVPRLSIAEARDTAFGALAFFHGSTILQEVEEFELAIVKPVAETEGRHDWYSAEQLAAGAAGRGILAYSGFFEDREILRSDGVGWHRYRVVIDAETGRVLALWRFRPMGGGAQSSDPPFGWNLGPGALRFTLNGREVLVEGEIERVAAPAKFESSSRVIVESNGMSLLAEFDAGQGLLRTMAQKPSYGRPDALTLAALANLGRAQTGSPR